MKDFFPLEPKANTSENTILNKAQSRFIWQKFHHLMENVLHDQKAVKPNYFEI
jgi:hypothetical protein